VSWVQPHEGQLGACRIKPSPTKLWESGYTIRSWSSPDRIMVTRNGHGQGVYIYSPTQVQVND